MIALAALVAAVVVVVVEVGAVVVAGDDGVVAADAFGLPSACWPGPAVWAVSCVVSGVAPGDRSGRTT